MTQSHFRSFEVEEVHQLDSLAFPQCTKVHSFRLVVELDFDWEDLDMLYRYQFRIHE
jgi:hypothetical protein